VPVLLHVQDLTAGYGSTAVLHGITFGVEPGEVVIILGANGAGKTTILRALDGMIPSRGTVEFVGRDLGGVSTDHRARLGLGHVPEGRGTVMDFTVDDNLRLGGYARPRSEVEQSMEHWFGVFPRLRERRDQKAAGLSGGEQQMLAVARALMGRPKLLLLDEPSMGLAPKITSELFAELKRINGSSMTAMLLVEQNAKLALEIADRAYVLETGTIVAEGPASQIANDDTVRRAYLGM
jgi:branched-chain amino acid transport system ATP-binding protein